MIYQQQNPIPRRSIPASMMYQQRNLVAEPSMPVPMMHQQRNLVAEPSMPVPMMHPQTMVAGPSMPVSMMPQQLNMVPGSSMPVCADSLQGVNNPLLNSVYTSYMDLEGTDTVDLGYNPLQNPVYTSMDLDDSHTVDLEKHPSGIVPTIQNIVSTVNLGCKLNLKKIALNARNAEYNPNRFAAVIMRIRQPKTTALIFATGKMVCTGAKSEDQSKIAARKFARIVQKIGFPAEFKDFKIQNIVASCDVKFIVSLERLASSHGFFSRYEPELFPGLIYDMKQPKIVLLIFVSGKVVLTGGKVREEIYEAFENIYPVLESYRKILKG